jgi:hypothetical protein
MPEIAKRLPLSKNITANKKLGKLFFVIFLGTIFYFIPKIYLGDTFPICVYRIILSKKCIGCGTTRAVWSILHFNFNDAYEYNKMIIITFPIIIGCIVKWILKK